MNPIIRNILAVLAGLLVGGIVNMGIIQISGSIIPPPEGIDITSSEGIKAGMEFLQPKHFIMPFLAHALGTLVGAFLAALIAANHKMKFALAIGFSFLIGGIMMVFMVPGPIWFVIVDLLLAYIPMAYLGAKFVTCKK